MRRFRYIYIMVATVLMTACRDLYIEEPQVPGQPLASQSVSDVIDASLSVEENPVYGGNPQSSLPPMATRAMVDQITTRRMDSNFLRIDEDIVSNTGQYTFKGYDDGFSGTVNWMKADLIEALVVSSPDNTVISTDPATGRKTGYFRSVSFDPVQTYYINVDKKLENNVEVYDTTHFYHTRMVGWYPRNCMLKRNAEGRAAKMEFNDPHFEPHREVDEDGRVSVKFTGLDGTVDLMVSDVREGQHWHRNNGHASDTDGGGVYREPFGYSPAFPEYANYFTYRHYLSAVRVFVNAEASSQNLQMWGDITGLKFVGQPTSVKVRLPEEVGRDMFGTAHSWGDFANFDINPGPVFGDDTNHPEFSGDNAVYPVVLGDNHSLDNIYMGHALVRPDSPVVMELHTTSGIYKMTVDCRLVGGTEIFKAGFIYNVVINLGTDGKIAAIIDDDSTHRYYDLTKLTELNVEGEDEAILTYQYANCYVIETSDARRKKLQKLEGGEWVNVKDENGKDVEYHGYAFSANTVGNGSAGILSSGAQTMYPTSANISPTYASLIWTDTKDLISNIELTYGYVRFCLHDPKDKKGNAVIGVFDDNDRILWSWHIWVVPELNTQSFTTSQNIAGSETVTLLDRNLGATKAKWTDHDSSPDDDILETYGLYYQWGRKDPSPGPPEWNYSIRSLSTRPYYDYALQEYNAAEVVSKAMPTLRDGVENPMYLIMPTQQTQSYYYNWTYELYNFLWGFSGTDQPTHKTIYDPCPFGYRVATSALKTLAYDAYHQGQSTQNVDLTDYGQILRHPRVAETRTYGKGEVVETTDDGFYFPYTGYKGVDRTMNSYMMSWKYVGEKADYQDATINPNSGSAGAPNVDYLARGRLYLSKSSSWEETSVGDYTGQYFNDFANRRTAAPVRCVKDVPLGVVLANITTDTRYITSAGTKVKLNLSAVSYSSNLSSIRLVAVWSDAARALKSEIITIPDMEETLGGTWAREDVDVEVKSEWIQNSSSVSFYIYATNDKNITAENNVAVTVINTSLNTDWWLNSTYPEVPALGNTAQLRGETTRRAVIYTGTVDPQYITNVQFRKIRKNDAEVTDEWHNGGNPYTISTPGATNDKYTAYLYYEFIEDEPGRYVYEMKYDIMGNTMTVGPLPEFEVVDWDVQVVWDDPDDPKLWVNAVYSDGDGTAQIMNGAVAMTSQLSGSVVTRKVKLTGFNNILNKEAENLTLTASMGTIPLTGVTRGEVVTDAGGEVTDIYYNVTFSKNLSGNTPGHDSFETFRDITLNAVYLGNVGEPVIAEYTVEGVHFDTSDWDKAYSDPSCGPEFEVAHGLNAVVYRKIHIHGNVPAVFVGDPTFTCGTYSSGLTVENIINNSAEGFDRTYIVRMDNLSSGTHDVIARLNWDASAGGGYQSAVLNTVVSGGFEIVVDQWEDHIYRTNSSATSVYPIQLAGTTVYRGISLQSASITTGEADVTGVTIGGVAATRLTRAGGTSNLNEIWCVPVNRQDGGVYVEDVEVIVEWSGGEMSRTVSLTTAVYEKSNTAATSLTAGGYYVIENVNLSGGYHLSGNENGFALGSNSMGYDSVFQLSGADSGTIKNAMHGTYLYNPNNENSLVGLTSNATTYEFRSNGDGTYFIEVELNEFLCRLCMPIAQSVTVFNDEMIGKSNTTNYYWSFYQLVPENQ